jgi:hypothetical protein
MNQFIYNNRVFYFDSAKYSPPEYNKFHNVLQNNNHNVLQNNNKPNIPSNINVTIIIPKKVKKEVVKKKETAAGKGYVAAKFLNKIR